MLLDKNLRHPSFIFMAHALAAISLSGCATLLQSGPGSEEQVTQVMTEWAAGWKAKDANRLSPLMSQDYRGLFDGTRDTLLRFVAERKSEAGTKIAIGLDEMNVAVHRDTATAGNVKIDAEVESGWTSHLTVEYQLQRGDDKLWRIVSVTRTDQKKPDTP